tara:strand:+ start:5309 stop:5992 length:684 start_codon:yes stop_codon:yes gene_type:complete
MKTKDPIYQECIELNEKQGNAQLGLSSSISWNDDPKRMTFLFSRYKFVAKMLEGFNEVLEVGCGDAFAARIVQQHVKKLTATDFDPVFIEDAKNIMREPWVFDCFVHDILNGPVLSKKFDAAYSLDVLEHMSVAMEDTYFKNIVSCLGDDGVFIVGMPSLNSQKFASPRSRAGHVNCKSLADLKKLSNRFFHNTFGFCMNDEVVHTGFHEMANYIFVLCCAPRKLDQ